MAEKRAKFDLEKIYKDIDEVVAGMQDRIHRVAVSAYEAEDDESSTEK